MSTALGAMRLLAYASGGYEGVEVAGIALVAADSGRVLLAQRAPDATDAEDVAETWEIPGGHLNPDEEPLAAALREFSEEVMLPMPEGEVVNGWRSDDEIYQGFVYAVDTEMDVSDFVPNDEVQAVGWFSHDEAMELPLRPEVRDTDWTLFDVSGNEEAPMDEPEMAEPEVEPDLSMLDLAAGPLPVHGVLAPEDAESGDSRGFSAGAVTARPYRLPFMWQDAQYGGHERAAVVGSVDRMMRKDGMIHWEGSLMPSAKAGEFAELLAFFGRFGVSVDGDRGSLDEQKSASSGVMWFDAVRAAGLTAVAIPAFSEAYVAFGAHPEMPREETEEFSVLRASGDAVTFDRGPGWVTHPVETKRLHSYWTSPGQPGYAKIGWGTPGDWTRAKKLIGEKIGANSPEDLRYLNQIISQWHHDALGYWPGELGKPGNAPDTPENRKRAAIHAAAETSDDPQAEAEGETVEAAEPVEGIQVDEAGLGWEAVLTSSMGARVAPPESYFTRHPDTGALVIEEPDENGVRRTYGYAGEWGVCHIGHDGRCVEVPEDDGTFPEFHLGRTKTDGGAYLNTGLITYKVDHRDARTILSETAEQQHFDNIAHAWAAVRLGVDERGIWFSGVVLPGVPEEDLVLIEAAGQVSGEWKYGALRALQAVNVPGFPVMRASAEVDDEGNVLALVASAFGTTDGCEPTPAERMAALAQADAHARFEDLRKKWSA